MKLFRRQRLHEPVALTALLSAGLTLNVAWIANLLAHRSPVVREWFTLSSEIGPISGLYLKTSVVFFLVFGLILLILRGRDCSHWRERAFWFFLASIVLFIVMTMPVIYEFSVVVE